MRRVRHSRERCAAQASDRQREREAQLVCLGSTVIHTSATGDARRDSGNAGVLRMKSISSRALGAQAV